MSARDVVGEQAQRDRGESRTEQRHDLRGEQAPIDLIPQDAQHGAIIE
ncbi:hypothetical protein SDC9_130628 [bioreactor metagenome]|uniref:Uncharacterized protein n=1 Tax=bioreactor metagenome TaxID=1076179 RepID=A0A645D2P6_9ZZZZ